MQAQSTYEIVHMWSTSFGLVLMVAMFIAVIVYAMWPGNKKAFEHAASLALNEDLDQADPKTERDR